MIHGLQMSPILRSVSKLRACGCVAPASWFLMWHPSSEISSTSCTLVFGLGISALQKLWRRFPGGFIGQTSASLWSSLWLLVTHASATRAAIGRSLVPAPLQPMPVPQQPWQSIGVDFVVQLPQTAKGHDAVCVWVNRFSKMVHLVPTQSTATAEDTVQMFVDHVLPHGVPTSIVSDRGTQFTSKLYAGVMQALGVRQMLSSAYHPQTDGQTE